MRPVKVTLALSVLALLFLLSLFLGTSFLCPHVPDSLSSRWRYLGRKDGTLIYFSPLDARSSVEEILRSYERVYYYSRSTDASELNLPLPDLPSSPDTVYMVTVPSRCGAETYAVLSDGNGARVYVGVVPLSSSVVPLDRENLFCESFAEVVGPAVSVSELLTKEGNVLRHYCYVQTESDFNSVLDVLSSRGTFVGVVARAHVYRLDNNLIVNVVPGSPLGIVAYRTVEARGPQ